MADLMIPDALANRLRDLAQRENRSVADVLETMIEQYEPAAEPETEEMAENPLLLMVQMAEEANLPFSETDVAERSREILNTEYADYLLKRMRGNDAEG